MSVTFETRRFLLDKFHDAAGVRAYLTGKGVPNPPSAAAIAKWLQRDSMPGEWLAVLAGLLEEDNENVGQLRAYIKGRFRK